MHQFTPNLNVLRRAISTVAVVGLLSGCQIGGAQLQSQSHTAATGMTLSSATLAAINNNQEQLVVVASAKSDFPEQLRDYLVSTKATDAAQVFTQFETLSDAITAVNASEMPTTILIAPGDYIEKVRVAASNVKIIGSGAAVTRLMFDDYAGKVYPDGSRLPSGGTAPLIIGGTDIYVSDISLINTFDSHAMERLPKGHPNKVSGTQASALYLEPNSDKVIFERVRIEGYQDTLFTQGKRAYIVDSFISGHVDFIFGRGNLLIENSEIQTRDRPHPNPYPHSYITAPSTKVDSEFGITILNSRLTREPGVPDNTVALGRPWHPTTTFADGRYADPFAKGKVIIANSWMDAHIMADGWYWMGGTARDGTKVPMLPENARFFEYQSSGPGALIADKRWQLPKAQVQELTRAHILSGWKF